MLRWVKKTLDAYFAGYIDRHLRALLDSGDYESVLRHATNMCQHWPKSARALYWRALALSWLGRYQESLEVTNHFEALESRGSIPISESWNAKFNEIKCGALSGLKKYDTLCDFTAACLKRHPGSISFGSFQLLAFMHLSKLTTTAECLHFLDRSVKDFDDAWQFVLLYSAHRHLRNEERAIEILQIARARFPDDNRIHEMASGDYITADAVSSCMKSRDIRHCYPK